MYLDTENLVNKAIRLELGSPLLPLLEGEVQVFDDAKELGLLDYWKAIPYVYTSSYTTGSYSGPLYINMADLVNFAFPGDAGADARAASYYLGVCTAQVANQLDSNMGNSFDRHLLGSDYVSGQSVGADYLGFLARASYQELDSGSIHFEFDRVFNQVKVIVNGEAGQISMTHGFGFTEYKYIQPAHVDLVAKLVLARGLRAILVSRSGISLSADFLVDTSSISSRLDAIQAWLDLNLPLYTHLPVLWD